MLNELGPFALLMHHFSENVNEFKRLAISDEELRGFKELVLSTLTQAIWAYNLDQKRKKRATQLYDEILTYPLETIINSQMRPVVLLYKSLALWLLLTMTLY